ncbi:MAG: PAS domain-containing protein [Proteobacteria bacterium]|nr:PAS domain-containing protein [Pseudomonadota bacterium]
MGNEQQGTTPCVTRAQTAAGFGVWEYDVESDRVFCDARLSKFLGLDPPGEGKPAILRDIVHPDDRAAVDAAVHAALADHAAPVSIICRLVHRGSGEIRRIASRGGRIDDGTSRRLAGILLPLETENALEDFFGSPEFVRALLGNRKVVAWAKDEQHRYGFVSENYQRLLGLNRAQWYGKTEDELWPAAIAARLAHEHDALLSDERPTEVIDRMVTPGGEESYWASSKFVFRDLPGRRYVGGLSVDITALKRAEQAKRTSELRLEAFLDNERFRAWVMDDHGQFVFMNTALRRALGLGENGLAEGRLESLLPAETAAAVLLRIREVLARGEATQFVEDSVDAGGQHRWWFKTKFPLVGADGRRYVGCMAMDISEQVELRRARDELRALLHQLQDGHELERKQLARDLHDVLGGTLTVLKSQLALLDAPSARNDPRRAAAIFEKMHELIDTLLCDADRLVSWLRPPSLDHLGLGAALEQLAREFSALYSIDCHASVPHALPTLSEPLTVNLYRIAQEGLTNVAKHANAHQAVIKLECVEARLVLTLEDDGQGKVSDAAARRGYGLLGMRERAHLLNGSLALDASPLGGLRLRISVPLAPST